VIEFDDPKKFLELSEDIGPKIIDTLEIEYPDTWNYTNGKIKKLVKLDKKTKEYDDIAIIFLVGKCRMDKIRSIERIQNPNLWSKYYSRKCEIMLKHGLKPQDDSSSFEKLLWHGTGKATNPLLIYTSDDGVDRRFVKYTYGGNDTTKGISDMLFLLGNKNQFRNALLFEVVVLNDYNVTVEKRPQSFTAWDVTSQQPLGTRTTSTDTSK